jgi:hypothetical protein
MKRRTVLSVLIPVPAAWAQPAEFPGAHATTLREIAAIVLPGEVDAERIALDFAAWVNHYSAGAETDHGYGNTRIRPKGASPAAGYMRDLGAFQGKVNRETISAALKNASVADLPRTPGGSHVAADLMAFYFRSSDANDLCYRAQIGRDQCRGLIGSDRPPAPLKGRA